MHATLLIGVYCVVAFLAALVGGLLPLLVRLTHRRMQIAISFVSGMILGIGLLHLLPHGFLILGSIDRTMGWVLGGFLFMFFLERLFHSHHHDAPEEGGAQAAEPALAAGHAHEAHTPGHSHAHDHQHPHQAAVALRGAAIGLTLHALVDGVAMAAAVQAEGGGGAVYWAGLGTAMAVVLHKPFDSLTIGTLLAAARVPLEQRRWLTVLYALVTPLGVLAYFTILESVVSSPQGLGEALAFAAGAFVCISTSDLLPELHFHRHDRLGLSAALLAGIGLAFCTMFLEPEGHVHPAGHPAEAADDGR